MEKIDKQLIETELEKASEAVTDWEEKILTQIDSLLMKNPISYRNYGPYWWNLKKILSVKLQNEGNVYQGDIEIETANEFDYGNDKLNIGSAVIYSYERANTEIYNHPTHDEYVIYDPGFEELAMFASVVSLPKSVFVR